MKKFFAVFFSVVAITFVCVIGAAKHHAHMDRIVYTHINPILMSAEFGRDDGDWSKVALVDINKGTVCNLCGPEAFRAR